jgi:hypothetical protein
MTACSSGWSPRPNLSTLGSDETGKAVLDTIAQADGRGLPINGTAAGAANANRDRQFWDVCIGAGAQCFSACREPGFPINSATFSSRLSKTSRRSRLTAGEGWAPLYRSRHELVFVYMRQLRRWRLNASFECPPA